MPSAAPTAPRTSLPLIFRAMGGLGDNVYARPFVRAWSAVRDVYVDTPWPQLFTDLPVKFMPPWRMSLRTQQKNMHRTAQHWWSPAPARYEQVRQKYALRDGNHTILDEIGRGLGWPEGQSFVFDLPDFGPSPVPGDVAVVRPVTVRREWANSARNPDPEYIAIAAAALKAAGYTVVSVADLDRGHEWALDPLPDADVRFHEGELVVEQLLALVQRARVVVGGIGWLVPAAIALGTPAVFVCGGQGGHNAPEIVTDPRMDLSRTRFIQPDEYCRCRQMKHECPKHITDFGARFGAALAEVAA